MLRKTYLILYCSWEAHCHASQTFVEQCPGQNNESLQDAGLPKFRVQVPYAASSGATLNLGQIQEEPVSEAGIELSQQGSGSGFQGVQNLEGCRWQQLCQGPDPPYNSLLHQDRSRCAPCRVRANLKNMWRLPARNGAVQMLSIDDESVTARPLHKQWLDDAQ